MHVHNHQAEPWRVTLVDTGQNTLTGGRLKRVGEYIDSEDAFCFTYGDGLSDVNITELIRFHMDHGCLAGIAGMHYYVCMTCLCLSPYLCVCVCL